MEDEKKQIVHFAAINPYVTTNIVSPKESDVRGNELVEWGDGNKYPQYINSLYTNVTLLRTIINGIADYVVGENVSLTYAPWAEQVNGNGDTVEDIVRYVSQDYGRYGGFALNVIRNRQGGIAEIYYIDFKNLRSDKKNEFFFYSEDWSKSYGRVKYTKYPKFRTDGKEYSSIYYYKNSKNYVYPISPIAGDGAVAAETEKSITEFHLNSIKNGFSSNVIINFNNGVPSDEEKEEIEKNLNEKFAGESNAGRMMVSFNQAKDNEVTVSKMEAADFGDRYQALSKSTKQEIYSAYRCSPQLFGLPNEQSGFNDQDYSQAFKIFQKTVILPIQKVIKVAFEKILGEKEVIVFEPLRIDWSEDEMENVITVK